MPKHINCGGVQSREMIRVDMVAGFQNCFNTMKYLGQWPPDGSDRSTIIKYWIYKVVMVTCFNFLYLACEIVYIFQHRSDLEKITEVSFLLMTHISLSIKWYVFTRKQRYIQGLLDLLHHPRFQERNQRQADILRRHISVAQFLFNLFMGMCLSTVSLWAIFPQMDQGENEWQLPLETWFPFRTDRPVAYELAYLYQVIAVAFGAFINVSMDIFVSAFMISLGGQLDLLNDTLLNLKEIAAVRIDQRLTDENNGRLPVRLEQEMDIIFAECVQHHWLILEFAQKIVSVFKTTLLSMFVTSVLIICITMFQLTIVEPFSILFFSMVLYQMCMVVEILFYCWFGNEIILKSSNICLSIFSSEWYRASVSYRRKLLIMMTCTQKPIQIYPWNLFILSLATFSGILRTSWSYFAVLRSVHSVEE